MRRAGEGSGDGFSRGRAVPADRAFWIKTRILAARHWALSPLDRQRAARPRRAPACQTDRVLLGCDSSPLYTASDPRERELELGKVENLRVAARALNGLVFDEGEIFGFWRAVGRPTRARGYVIGRELRQGCLVPTVAGGICQLTNALSRAASRAGMEIVERHAHSAQVADLVIDPETDATVFWNYIDLRFRATRRFRLSIALTAETLEVGIEAPA